MSVRLKLYCILFRLRKVQNSQCSLISEKVVFNIMQRRIVSDYVSKSFKFFLVLMLSEPLASTTILSLIPNLHSGIPDK